MVLSKDQSNSRINSEDNLANLLKHHRQKSNNNLREITGDDRLNITTISDSMQLRPSQNSGKRKGDKNMPPFLREVIAITAQSDNCRDTAEAFGTSKSHVNNLSNGKISNNESPQLQSAIDKTLEVVRDTAVEKLMASLGFIDDSKLKVCSAKDLSSISANMSKIVTGTIPQKSSDDKPRIIVYAPEISQINNYQVLETE